MRFWYLLGVFSKISDEHARHFHREVTRISAAALINIFAPQVRRLIEGGAHSSAALIKKLDATKKYFFLI